MGGGYEGVRGRKVGWEGVGRVGSEGVGRCEGDRKVFWEDRYD